MKQVLQSLKDGSTLIEEVPAPRVSDGHLIIESTQSLISAGTERMLVAFGKAGLIDKARQQPEKVRLAFDKARTDGVIATLESIRTKLDQPMAMGYCNVGRVASIGPGVNGFQVGDRVVSNGPHAEVVKVSANLCAKIPDIVEDDVATFTVIAAIALQGIRLAKPTLGECVVVTGLGLIGLVAVQLLRAQGCRVMGVDFDTERLRLAGELGAEITADPSESEKLLSAADRFSRGRGVDAVIISASTDSDQPISQAARMCRKRGRIVLVGVAGLRLSRDEFYKKELTFQVSCSYGPGRYDPAYEEKGQDYPLPYVRWTEQRNFEAVLDLMATGRLDPRPLISHRFPLSNAGEAYEVVRSSEASLGILLTYSAEGRVESSDSETNAAPREAVVTIAPPNRMAVRTRGESGVSVAFVGAGNYASRVLMPAFAKAGAHFETVVSGGGVSASHFGRKFGFRNATTDFASVIDDPNIDLIVIATRHDMHAEQTVAALQAGKHVYVEKPLGLSHAEIDKIEAAYRASPGVSLMVGYNRRFAPHVLKIRDLLAESHEPKAFIMLMNAGMIPDDHWTQDLVIGGGRIVGEACHHIDLMRSLAESEIASVRTVRMERSSGGVSTEDKAIVSMAFDDGSIGAVHYLANGSPSFPKERVEVFCGGKVLQLDNFKTLRGFGWSGFSSMRLWRQDKGQRQCVARFVDSIEAGDGAPIPAAEIFEVARTTLNAAAQLRRIGGGTDESADGV